MDRVRPQRTLSDSWKQTATAAVAPEENEEDEETASGVRRRRNAFSVPPFPPLFPLPAMQGAKRRWPQRPPRQA